MKTPINRSELFRQAWHTAKTWHIEFSKALRYTWRLFKRYSPIVEIEFVKKSTGEITKRVGTALKEDKGAVLFWSLSDNGWRKAICNNILTITPTYVNVM